MKDLVQLHQSKPKIINYFHARFGFLAGSIVRENEEYLHIRLATKFRIKLGKYAPGEICVLKKSKLKTVTELPKSVKVV